MSSWGSQVLKYTEMKGRSWQGTETVIITKRLESFVYFSFYETYMMLEENGLWLISGFLGYLKMLLNCIGHEAYMELEGCYEWWLLMTMVCEVVAYLTFASLCIIIQFKWINQQNATVSQVYYLTFMRGSTCFGRFLAHHQELTTALAASGFTVGA